ncbi:MAG TPA: NHL repeat-containing protein [Atribacteraceae bacterium]|nr:NHL repeat-containing protein [Atribacteraceae bacterium]
MSPKPRRLFIIGCFMVGIACFVPFSGLAQAQWEVELVFDEVEDDLPFLDYPVAVLVDEGDGSVYVSDWGNNRVVVFDREGNTQQIIGDVNGPVGLAMDLAVNRLYVVEMLMNRVKILDADTYAVLGYLEALNPPLYEPRGITIDGEGLIYVVDTNRSRVVVFDREGRQIYTFGREGMGNDEFFLPRGIAIDQTGRIWIADTVHHAVKVFDREKNFLFRFGQGGSGETDFDRVRYITIRGNYVFISDYNNHRLKVYDLEGNLVEIVGGRGSGHGQFVSPEGVWADNQGKVWIADAGNSRIQKLNFSYLIDRRSHLDVLLREGRIDELLTLAGTLPQEKRDDPAVGRLLFEAYQRKGNTDQMLHHAEILWVSDEENRDYWRNILGGLYYQQAISSRGFRPMEEIRELFQKAYRLGNTRAFFSYLWVSFLLFGGSSVMLIFLGIFLFVLLIIFYRLKTSRFRRW